VGRDEAPAALEHAGEEVLQDVAGVVCEVEAQLVERFAQPRGPDGDRDCATGPCVAGTAAEHEVVEVVEDLGFGLLQHAAGGVAGDEAGGGGFLHWRLPGVEIEIEIEGHGSPSRSSWSSGPDDVAEQLLGGVEIAHLAGGGAGRQSGSRGEAGATPVQRQGTVTGSGEDHAFGAAGAAGTASGAGVAVSVGAATSAGASSKTCASLRVHPMLSMPCRARRGDPG
jgi:hypothetical protein